MNQQHVDLAEILAALSRALDLTEGRTDGHTVRSCLIGMRLAEAIGLGDDPLGDLYYALLLKGTGRSAHLASTAEDDDDRVPARQRGERGAYIVRKLGLGAGTAAAVHALDERWDGGGSPDGLAGEAIPLLARVAAVAQALETLASEHGPRPAFEELSAGRGTRFDPGLVDAVACWAEDCAWWQDVLGPGAAEAVLRAEPPGGARRVSPRGVNRVAEAFAEVIDAGSAYTRGHSRGVARCAVAVAEEMGLAPAARLDAYRGGLLHDIGKLGIPGRILDKPGPLTPHERERIRVHPVHGWRVLEGVRAFGSFARDAMRHHERLDGKGYPWGIGGDDLGATARVLAVANAYEALTARRSYREALAPTAALALLERDRGSAFDPVALDALSAVALADAEPVLGAA